MRRTTWLAALIACSLPAAPARAAAILYNATDLGSDQRKPSNADGSYSGITNAAGTATYAFTKVPVTPIDVQLPTRPLPDNYLDNIQTHLTMQAGAYQVGTSNVYALPLGIFTVPSFQTPTNLSWSSSLGNLNNAWIGPGPTETVSDLNKQGQVVGVGVLHPGKSGATFAAFSAPGLMGHGGYSPTVDNLNNYIAPLPGGIALTAAVKIDDLGRILAIGSDSHDYLLTPVALGDAATVPEPTTLATLGVLGGMLSIRALVRRRRGNHGGPTS